MAKAVKTKASVEAAQDIPAAATDTFKVKGKTYKFTMGKLNIPGVGIRTALEMLLDKETYPELGGLTITEWLVDISSGAIIES